jgi:hypothetical protein
LSLDTPEAKSCTDPLNVQRNAEEHRLRGGF